MGNLDKAVTDAELTVLAVLLNDSYAVVPVMGALDAGDFSTQEHQAIYRTILDCVKRQVVPNPTTVASALPSVAVDSLKDIAHNFNTQKNKQVLYYADLVTKAAMLRRLRQMTHDLDVEAQELRIENIDGFVELGMQALTNAVEGDRAQDASIGAALAELDAAIAEAERTGHRGVSTGLAWLDDKTGGFSSSHVWMVAAAYKQRKTTLMRNMVIGTCRAGGSVDMFALEGNKRSTSASLLAMLATEKLIEQGHGADELVVSEARVECGLRTPAQQYAIEAARKELASYNLRIYDARNGVTSFATLALKLKRDKFMFGTSVFFLDYLQMMRGDGQIFERVERSTHDLQDLIATEGVTGVILAQRNEAAVKQSNDDDNYSPGVKGGGDPAAAADFLLLTKYDGDDKPDKLSVHLKLARHAQPGKWEYDINPQSGFITSGRTN